MPLLTGDNVVKTMPCLPPMTGNGKFLPPIKMVKLGMVFDIVLPTLKGSKLGMILPGFLRILN